MWPFLTSSTTRPKINLPAGVLARRSVLPMPAYVARLALLGQLSIDDFLDFDAEQFRRIGHSLLTREALLAETITAHESKLAELEAANRVLEQRTRSLVSLQEFGQALIASVDLRDLARRICRFAIDLCGADRVIVYYLHSNDDAENSGSRRLGAGTCSPPLRPYPCICPLGYWCWKGCW